MGISRRSIFLHTLASCSGVNVGGVSESIDSDSLFSRCSRYVVDGLSSFAAIGKEGAKEEERGRGEGEGEPLGEVASHRSSL